MKIGFDHLSIFYAIKVKRKMLQHVSIFVRWIKFFLTKYFSHKTLRQIHG